MLTDGSFQVGGIQLRDFTPLWAEDFDPGVETVETTDLENPAYDETYPGVDMHRAPTWTFTIIADGGRNPAAALAAAERVKKVWRNPDTTKTAGRSIALYYGMAGRTRFVYGRPRRFAMNPTKAVDQGFVRIEADFRLTDPLFYDGEQRREVLHMVPPESTGLKETLHEMLSTEQGGERQGSVEDIGSDAPTPFTVRVHGPIQNPGFSFQGNSYQFNLTLREGETLVVDSRQGTARVGSRNVLSLMTRRTRLKTVRLKPGGAELRFSGIDPTMTSYAEYLWYPAHYSM